jgi:hypothetical protein
MALSLESPAQDFSTDLNFSKDLECGISALHRDTAKERAAGYRSTVRVHPCADDGLRRNGKPFRQSAPHGMNGNALTLAGIR